MSDCPESMTESSQDKYTSSFISRNNILPESHIYVADPTTALTLASADQAEMSYGESESPFPELAPSSTVASKADSSSPLSARPQSGGEDSFINGDNEGNQLIGVLNDLMINSLRDNHQISVPLEFNTFTETNTPIDDTFIQQKIAVDKSELNFREKLKHFFVLSVAGKPIYSLNGDDDVIMGYMGLITTILSTFSEGVNSGFKAIHSEKLSIVVMSKPPLLLVAITKVPYELLSSTSSSVLENQLSCIYNYIVAVLSKSTITKNFDRGMNYDLRRILTPQDFYVIDTMAMKLTYGFHASDEQKVSQDTLFFLSTMLDNALQSSRISNHSRSRLNDIFLSCKKLKAAKDGSEVATMFSDKIASLEHGNLLAADLLFGFIVCDMRVLSYLHPKSHSLKNEDIQTLLSIVTMSSKSLPESKSTDLWIPICMPNFNSSGFLYTYVRKFNVKAMHPSLTLILMSGNKNSFFSMKEVASYLIAKTLKKSTFVDKLSKEIKNNSSVLSELNISTIKHFIYKRKDLNQIYIDGKYRNEDSISETSIKDTFSLVYFYSNLIASGDCTAYVGQKKLTYTRWQQDCDLVTGFRLSDEHYEFYCLCSGIVSSQEIIKSSLKVINWCEYYRKRIFVGDGVSF